MSAETTKLEDILISNDMMDAKQITAFTEATYEHKGATVHLSGDKDIGTLQLSGNFIVGINNNIYSTENGNFIAVGQANDIGAYGYQISALEHNSADSTTIVKVKGEIDQRVDELKPLYSLDTVNATLNVGRVVSVDFSQSAITVEGLLPLSYATSIIYFAEYPMLGNEAIQVGHNSFTYGRNNVVVGNEAFAGGRQCIAGGNYAHAEGKKCVASWGAHAEGANNEALRECGHAEGRFQINKGICSTAKGGANYIANGCRQAEVGGYMAMASSDLAYVWNGAIRYGYQGDSSKQYGIAMQYELVNTTLPQGEERTVEYMHSKQVLSDMYHSHGQGTFNINPQRGLSGFYIGEKSLYQHILENSQSTGAADVLSGKTYSLSATAISTMLIDIVQALGATTID